MRRKNEGLEKFRFELTKYADTLAGDLYENRIQMPEFDNILVCRRTFHEVDGQKREAYDYYRFLPKKVMDSRHDYVIAEGSKTIVLADDYRAKDIRNALEEGKNVVTVGKEFEYSSGCLMDIAEIFFACFAYFYRKGNSVNEAVAKTKALFEDATFAKQAVDQYDVTDIMYWYIYFKIEER